MTIDPDDIPWHDGILVDVQVAGLEGDRRELNLLLDLYPDREPQSARRRYRCTGTDLKRILVSADIGRLVANRASGNVDHLRVDVTTDTEILVISLIGGVIEAEASEFHLTEVES